MASEGPNSPGTLANVDRSGHNDWSNPGNAAASDDSRATVFCDKHEETDWLRATNFGFSIPAGATIDGIEVVFERRSTGGPGGDISVRLWDGSSAVGDDKSTGQSDFWTFNTDTDDSFGGASDDWNAGLGPSDINDSGFGCQLAAEDQIGNTVTLEVDHVEVTIYYTEASSGIVRKLVGGGGLVGSGGLAGEGGLVG